ncbi:pseudoazurin [Ochrobactrum sp. MYb379]|uniref:pseudoazurin n=1 Tax=Ochrobactrum sp. MYb379 TaxID=2745275 RepID=UPI0030A8D8D0
MKQILFKASLTAILIACGAVSVGAETFEVKMLNGNATGGMVFEPDYLRITPGDRVKFVATQRGHNAASIADFYPESAEPFKGKINEEIEVVFTEGGFYGIKCTPHYDMGMVMLIQVGEHPIATLALPNKLPKSAHARFKGIAERSQNQK